MDFEHLLLLLFLAFFMESSVTALPLFCTCDAMMSKAFIFSLTGEEEMSFLILSSSLAFSEQYVSHRRVGCGTEAAFVAL